jgi:hypothetical protein
MARGVKRRVAAPWWQTIMLAAIAVMLSAIATGSLAFIVDHILWE